MLIWLFYTFVNGFSSLPSLSLGLEKWLLFFFACQLFSPESEDPFLGENIFVWKLEGGGMSAQTFSAPLWKPKAPSAPYLKMSNY